MEQLQKDMINIYIKHYHSIYKSYQEMKQNIHKDSKERIVSEKKNHPDFSDQKINAKISMLKHAIISYINYCEFYNIDYDDMQTDIE